VNENPLDTQPDPPGVDPWDRIHDADRDIHLPATPQSHDTAKQKGVAPIILILVGLTVIGSAIGWFGYNFLTAWLKLP
jgi:hypothetical protein